VLELARVLRVVRVIPSAPHYSPSTTAAAGEGAPSCPGALQPPPATPCWRMLLVWVLVLVLLLAHRAPYRLLLWQLWPLRVLVLVLPAAQMTHLPPCDPPAGGCCLDAWACWCPSSPRPPTGPWARWHDRGLSPPIPLLSPLPLVSTNCGWVWYPMQFLWRQRTYGGRMADGSLLGAVEPGGG
jgi:hypothetical protein